MPCYGNNASFIPYEMVELLKCFPEGLPYPCPTFISFFLTISHVLYIPVQKLSACPTGLFGGNDLHIPQKKHIFAPKDI